MSKLEFIIGATAVGKTDYAINYAKKINAEIISCDSLLVYKGMNIGTAKPSKKELNEITHHCINLYPVNQLCDITMYTKYANMAVEKILKRGKPIIITGGSGFYLKSFFEPIIDTVKISPDTRKIVNKMFIEEGLNGLLNKLNKLNPDGLSGLDTNNPRRVQRALERVITSGKSLQELKTDFLKRDKPFNEFSKEVIHLSRDSKELKDRVKIRVDNMIKNGLIEEVSDLITQGIEKNPSAANAIGYRETIAFLRNRIQKSELIPLIVKNTYSLIKKQNTWFRTQFKDINKKDILLN